jgi:beta-glucosidase
VHDGAHGPFHAGPFVNGLFGAAFVKGLQGNNSSKYLQANAGCKHFADFAGPRNSNMDHKLSERDRVTTYLPQFKRCVEAGAPSLMCAYSATNGRPACGDSGLLNDILRTEWGFQGCACCLYLYIIYLDS